VTRTEPAEFDDAQRGTRAFYQVRIGADTRPAADDLCNRIRRAGGACFVLKNMRG